MIKIKDGLYIGDIEHGMRSNADTVISLTKDKHDNTDIHLPLTDGENEFRKYIKTIDKCYDEYIEKDKVLIHCSVGISRSPAVAATIIAMDEGKTFEKAMVDVRSERIIANPEPALVKLSKRYLGESDD